MPSSVRGSPWESSVSTGRDVKLVSFLMLDMDPAHQLHHEAGRAHAQNGVCYEQIRSALCRVPDIRSRCSWATQLSLLDTAMMHRG